MTPGDDDDKKPEKWQPEIPDSISAPGPGSESSGTGASGAGGTPFGPVGGMTEGSASTTYSGFCDVGNHPSWKGPTRTTYADAQSDCDSHNQRCDAQGAKVVTF
jgi:hypothetical protein